MMCLLELLTKADQVGCAVYDFSIVEDMAIIEVTRKDNNPISETEILWFSGVMDSHRVISGEEWKGEWRNDSYHYGIYSLNSEDENKEIRSAMDVFQKDWLQQLEDAWESKTKAWAEA